MEILSARWPRWLATPRSGLKRLRGVMSRGGVEAVGDRRHSNPGAKERALLDEAGEAELLEALAGPPPGGGMWSGPKVARWIARRNGLEKVHVQRGFEYLRKVRYSPQVPRPENASADASGQEAFKKLCR